VDQARCADENVKHLGVRKRVTLVMSCAAKFVTFLLVVGAIACGTASLCNAGPSTQVLLTRPSRHQAVAVALGPLAAHPGERFMRILDQDSDGAATSDQQRSDAFARVHAYLRQPAVFQAEQNLLRGSASHLPGLCPALAFRSTKLTLVDPPLFETNGTLRSGTFRETWTGDGCGDSHPVLNLWAVVAPGTTPRLFTSFPGDSIASPQLQHDFYPLAIASAAAKTSSCTKMEVVNTHFAGFEGAPTPSVNGRTAQPWHEDWLLMGCGHAVKVVVHFVPDTSGTSGRLQSEETTLLQ
jgi:hypothetical protein